MKKYFLLIFMFFFLFVSFSQATVLQGGVSMEDRVPEGFYANWRVTSVCIKSTNPKYLNSKGVDIWNLSKKNDIIILTNPWSGAKAYLSVNDVNGNTVKFVKEVSYPDEESVETPILTLNGDNFTGIDKINIKTYKNGQLINEEYVEYQVKGTKISGVGLSEIFGY